MPKTAVLTLLERRSGFIGKSVVGVLASLAHPCSPNIYVRHYRKSTVRGRSATTSLSTTNGAGAQFVEGSPFRSSPSPALTPLSRSRSCRGSAFLKFQTRRSHSGRHMATARPMLRIGSSSATVILRASGRTHKSDKTVLRTAVDARPPSLLACIDLRQTCTTSSTLDATMDANSARNQRLSGRCPISTHPAESRRVQLAIR